MTKALLCFTAAALLSGCAIPVAVVYDASRTATRGHVTRALAITNPELEAEAATDCVMAGFKRAEVVKFGTSDTTVLTTAHRAKIAEVAARAKPAACLAALPKSA